MQSWHRRHIRAHQSTSKTFNTSLRKRKTKSASVNYFAIVFPATNKTHGTRAGLKPMQPMQLHWAPHLWGPRGMVFGQAVHFCQILLELENSVETVYKPHY